jgi:site-specific recombinase XerD
MTALAPTLQAFFIQRLINQKDASPRTIAAYRDTLKLLLRYASERTDKPPSKLDFADLDASLISGFLDHLEQERGNTARTRNARLAAIHSLYRFAALRHPEHAHTIARVIEIPTKRHTRPLLCYLDLEEITALLNAPNRATWLGRRDHALMLLTIQTGVRVSELTNLRLRDVSLERPGAYCRVIGKGRKTRSQTLTAETVQVLRDWLHERNGAPDDPVFPTRRGEPLGPRGVAWLIDKHTTTAASQCPSLATKRVTPHVLRHTNAMLLRAKNVDILTIALWLGHESTTTTEVYLHADNRLKQEAIDRTTPTGTPPGRYQPTDAMIAFLDQL